MSLMKDMSDLISAVPAAPPKFVFTLPELEILFKSVMAYYENLLEQWENGDIISPAKLSIDNFGYDIEDCKFLEGCFVGNEKNVCLSLIKKFAQFNFSVE